jgi:toxin-antitoxin system PIN domain toxin
MPHLCDVNLLLALCDEAHIHHPAACAWLESVEEPASVFLCRVTQLGLLRLLTNPALLGARACPVRRAWRVWDTLLSDERFAFQDEPPHLEKGLREFTRGFTFSPKLWQDAYLAAFAHAAGLRLVTFDRGFRKFKGLDCHILPPS